MNQQRAHIIRLKTMIEAKKPDEVEELKEEVNKLRLERDSLNVLITNLAETSETTNVAFQVHIFVKIKTCN